MEALRARVERNEETIGVIGLGYVGLPLAVTFAMNEVKVIGFEKNVEKINKIQEGISYISDVKDCDLLNVVEKSYLKVTSDFSLISECDAVIICVPTPLDKFKKPDMSFIESACIEIGRSMSKKTFISLESTTYPTTTENYMLPIIERESGMKHGEDFWLAFSPERVDPGNKEYKTENTPKVFGAMTDEGREIGQAIYSKAIKNIHTVSSPRIAEMVKILENTYRLVNISLINELALLCGKMEIDIWEVIDAAKTKPFGFQAFYPGPGIGGHCIPLDPFYLEHIAKNYNFDLTMIHTAGQIDTLMPHRMTVMITSALNKQKKAINGSKILFLGVAYKPDIDDERESPALKIIDEVAKKGGEVFFHDPHIKNIKTEKGRVYSNTPLTDDVFVQSDCIVITTNHAAFNEKEIIRKANLVVDLRNMIKGKSEKVYKL